MAEYLTQHLAGTSFEIAPLRYDEIYPAAEHETIDFILANSAFYVGLERRYRASRIVTLKTVRLGVVTSVYAGVIFVRADRTDIQTIEDIKGQRLMALDERAFASWPATWLEMKHHGIDPYRDVAELRFGKPGETMDQVVFAVRDRTVDVGCIRSDLLEQLENEGKIRIADFRVLNLQAKDSELPFQHSTMDYPEWPLAKLHHVPDLLGEQVAAALLAMPPDSEAALASHTAGWTIPHNYQPVHETLKELRIEPYASYGQVTARQIVVQYWPWLFGGVTTLLLVGALYLTVNNRRLRKELGERTEIMVRNERLVTLGRLTASVGHELRNPLGTIRASTFTIARKIADHDLGLDKALKRMEQNIARCDRIIEELLDYTRTRHLELEQTDLDAWLAEALDEMIIPNNVTLERELESGVTILIDRERLRRCCVNLLDNAFDALAESRRDGGDRSGRATVSTELSSDTVFIRFSDTGIGIDDSDRAKITEPLYSTKNFGVGLGLPIVFQIIEQHGGEVGIESVAGRGTTVTIALPTMPKEITQT